MRRLEVISTTDNNLMIKLANGIINSKWPRNDTTHEIIEFLFGYTHFIKTFIHLGNIYTFTV